MKHTALDAEFFHLKRMYMRAFAVHPVEWRNFHYPPKERPNAYENPLLFEFHLYLHAYKRGARRSIGPSGSAKKYEARSQIYCSA